jgi:hypothetical protein
MLFFLVTTSFPGLPSARTRSPTPVLKPNMGLSPMLLLKPLGYNSC